MLIVCEWFLKINFILAKWCYGLFVLSLPLGYILHNYIVTGCSDGAIGYGGCMYKGLDVSTQVNDFAWGTILLFAAGSIFTIIFKVFDIGVSQHKSYKQDNKM